MAFEKGAVGEMVTAHRLQQLSPEWTIFHDVRWPGRARANIDHIAIGPGGVYVVDSKNWSGDVRVSAEGLRQNGRSRARAVTGVQDSALAVATLSGRYAEHVKPVLCFVQQPQLAGRAGDVLICGADNLVEMLLSRQEVLTIAEVRDASLRLDVELKQCGATSNRTVSRLRQADVPSSRPLRSSPPVRRTSHDASRRELRRLVLALTMVVLIILAASSGLLTQAAELFAESFVAAVIG